jgi:hypothetical protein
MTDDLETEARSGDATVPVSQDDKSEQLDDDKLTGDFPPDAPLGSTQYGITAQEQRIDEPIAERVAREKPETATVGQPDEAGRLVAPDEGTGPDDEAAAVASAVEGIPPHDITSGDIGIGDSTTRDTATEMVRDLSAEESAVHVVEED